MNRTSKVILSIFGTVGVLSVVLITGFLVYLYITNRTFDTTLATNLNVATEWTEIRPDQPLQTRRIVAELAMTLPNYRAERGGKFEIKLPDGRLVKPQVQVMDSSGNLIELKHSGFTFTGDEDLIIFTPMGGFPETTYSKVMVRSDIPFTCERMFWCERNPK